MRPTQPPKAPSQWARQPRRESAPSYSRRHQITYSITAGALWISKLRKTPAITGPHSPMHSFHNSPFYFFYIYFNIILACKYASEEPLSFAFFYEYHVVCVARPYVLHSSLVTVCCPNNAPVDTRCRFIPIKILQDAQLSSKWQHSQQCHCSLWRYSALCHETQQT